MSLDDLTRYEHAAIARLNVEEKPGLALASMHNFYDTYILPETEDPISQRAIARAFEDASVGASEGLGISDAGILQSIGVFSKKYNDSFSDITVSEAVDYLGKGYKLPETVIEGISKYKYDKISDLKDEKAKEVIDSLKIRRLKTLGLKMDEDSINKATTGQLLKLYPEPEKKEEKN